MLEQHPADTTIIRRILLIGGGVCLVVAGVCLFLINTQPLKQASTPVDEDVQPQFQAEKLSAISNLGVMVNEVRPLQQTTRVVASGQHSAEFRGTHFIQENLNNYSLELFITSKEEIIQDFLDKRADRSKFIYLRLAAEHQPERYVLLYGNYAGEADAEQQLQQLNLALPKTIHPRTVQFKDYTDLVNDMGTEELSNQKLYSIELKPAVIPPPAIVPKVSSASVVAPVSHALQTTVTRHDREGNVVSVTRSAGLEASVPH
ncbi:hypothetical protein [Acinetobacter sp. ANC 4641]|uniref:hypothetical protein n=1 Tax=Acinetobacter sp. ANC 4641 TaxID=2529847 RepID=UPI001039BF5B|nr:hypothetical protein [Acinetobacter sp. ANC 4641]TCB13552.1 hypothetical protein E0H78_02815 [Acinetobacter sp. ANC 4641]